MARKVGRIFARGERTWLVRIYFGRDPETKKRRYHNHTIHGPAKHAQMYLTKKLRERDLGRGIEGVQVTLNEYLDRWFETAAKPRLREKSYEDYEGLLRRYIRPALGNKLLTSVSTLDIQGVYQQMIEAGLANKQGFECPPEHVQMLSGLLHKVDRILIVGWRASGRSFLDLLKTGLKREVRVVVVNKDEREAQQVVEQLRTLEKIKGTYTAHPGGFTNFVTSRDFRRYFAVKTQTAGHWTQVDWAKARSRARGPIRTYSARA